MANLIAGSATFLFAAVLIYFSWRLFRRRSDGAALLLLCAAGLALRLFTASDLYLHNWDERYHALVAKNMMSHPLHPTLYEDPVLPYDYRDWTANHIWVHKQPVVLWAMAGSMALFGVNEIAVRLPSVLLTTLGIWLIFVIGKYFFDRRTGYLAACFFAVNGLILELAGGRMPTDHYDIFFLFFTELAVFFTVLFVRKEKTIFNLLAGASIGLAILTKWLPALIVLPVWLLLVAESGKFSYQVRISQFIWLVLSAAVISTPWQLYIYRAFPEEAAWEALFNWRHITEPLENNTGPFYFFLDKIRINYGEMVYIPLAWAVYRLWKSPDQLKLWALFLWFTVPFVFFSSIPTKMQGYLLFTAPVLFILTAAFFWRLNEWKNRFRFPLLINIILFIFLALPVRYAIERAKPFEKRDRNPEWVKELRAKGSGLRENSERQTADRQRQTANRGTVLFNYPRPVEAMFYTDMIVYKIMPDSAVVSELLEQGYRVKVHDNGQLPDELLKLEDVSYWKTTSSPPASDRGK